MVEDSWSLMVEDSCGLMVEGICGLMVEDSCGVMVDKDVRLEMNGCELCDSVSSRLSVRHVT